MDIQSLTVIMCLSLALLSLTTKIFRIFMGFRYFFLAFEDEPGNFGRVNLTYLANRHEKLERRSLYSDAFPKTG